MTFDELLQKLKASAVQVDAAGEWPRQQFEWLKDSGILRWQIPESFGGIVLPEVELSNGYARLATACLSTCFALTQRIGAIQRIAGSKNDVAKEEILPPLALGEIFATVGVSHLTTSMQHLGKPAVQAEIQEDQVILSGMIPWVTGSTSADFIVTGGTCADDKQILIAMPTHLEGVTVRNPIDLMALTASQTSSIDLNQVVVPRRYLLAGPVENVMKRGKGGGAGSVTTSTLALGLAERSLQLLKHEAEKRDELMTQVSRFDLEVSALRNEIHAALLGEAKGDDGLSPTAIRHKANSLVLRITQSALTITKGAGFAKGHPAELSVREAMFFLVWSCPQPVVEGVLNELSCRDSFV